MLPVERVKAALYFNKPDKVPIFNLVKGDVLPLPLTHSENWKPGWNEGEEGLFPHIRGSYNWDRPNWAKNLEFEGNKWRNIPHEEIDEFGCIWNMQENDTNMGHPGRAPLQNWEDFEEYISKYTPDPTDKSRYKLALNLKENSSPNQYRLIYPSYHGPSQIASYLRGFNTFLIDHKRNPIKLKQLLEHIADYHVQVLRNSIKIGLEPHGIYFDDDLGSQNAPFCSPNMFKSVYDSSYTRIFNEAHELGLEVHLHSCGKIDSLIPILMDWGLDAIELDSPRMSGYVDLAPYRGKIMFWACVNIQSIYPMGTPEEIEREVWHMIRNLGTRDGGFGAYFYDTPRDINVPRRNIKAFQSGLEKYGIYSKIPDHWWDYPVSKNWDYYSVPPLPPTNI
jgi:hypothetical protein